MSMLSVNLVNNVEVACQHYYLVKFGYHTSELILEFLSIEK